MGTLPSYTFAEVNNTKGLGLAYSVGKFDGICGMGWDDISVDHVKTPVRALVDSKKLDANVFAFHLGIGGAAGELVLGGVNPAHYSGDFAYTPVIDSVPGKRGYWALAMDDITIGGSSVTSVRKAIIDSGTSLLAAPTSDIKQIAKLVGAKRRVSRVGAWRRGRWRRGRWKAWRAGRLTLLRLIVLVKRRASRLGGSMLLWVVLPLPCVSVLI